MNEIKELLLDDIYNLDVNVIYKNDKYSGTLNISKKKIQLSFSFEENSIFTCNDFYKYLSCEFQLNYKINLYNLSLEKSSWKTISRQGENIHFNEYLFDVEYLFFDKVGMGIDSLQSFYSIRIISDDISEWLGNTNKQFNLLTKQKNENATEFICKIDDDMHIILSYSKSFYRKELSEGTTLTPELVILFSSEKNIEYIHKKINQLKDLFNFIIGRNIKFDKILLNNDESFFYKDIYEEKKSYSYVFFPNTKNIRFPYLNYEFDFNIFIDYFNLTNHKRNLFREFIKYRTFSNSEESFLGYYRILEYLTIKKKKYFETVDNNFINRIKNILKKNNQKKTVDSFISRCVKLNNTKYNTQKCFSDFFKSIDIEIKEKLNFDILILEDISKLRNDITHLNEYNTDAKTLTKYNAILEFLLILFLLRLLKVNDKTINILSNRYDKFHLIRKD